MIFAAFLRRMSFFRRYIENFCIARDRVDRLTQFLNNTTKKFTVVDFVCIGPFRTASCRKNPSKPMQNQTQSMFGDQRNHSNLGYIHQAIELTPSSIAQALWLLETNAHTSARPSAHSCPKNWCFTDQSWHT